MGVTAAWISRCGAADFGTKKGTSPVLGWVGLLFVGCWLLIPAIKKTAVFLEPGLELENWSFNGPVWARL